MKVPPLKKDEVHLWYQILEPSIPPSQAEAYLRALPLVEREKYETIIAPSKKNEYLQTRTLVRKVLSQYISVPPMEWEFCPNPSGRPGISNPSINLPLIFNISHCQGLVVCAIGLKCELGVDVEWVTDFDDLLQIAQDNFSQEEFQELKDLPQPLKISKFYECWTLKEAYLKARGTGFSANITFDKNPNDWQFKLIRPTHEHQLALAIHENEKSTVNIVEMWADQFKL